MIRDWRKSSIRKDRQLEKEKVSYREKTMQSPCMRQVSEACFHGCWACGTPPFLGLPTTSSTTPMSKYTTSVAASHVDFAVATASSLVPDIQQFTNHECLPSLSESFAHFIKAFPQYTLTDEADQIRAQEYYHLSVSNQVCLDYIGHGLFSHSQQVQCSSEPAASASTSTAPPPPPPQNLQFPFFDVSYKSTTLYSQVIYGAKESELESALRKRIMSSLNISETDYSMVFTANSESAFKLLAESYPFQSNKRLLTVYDNESEAVSSMIDNSQKRGAEVMSAEFSWPRMRVNSNKLRKMVVSKGKKKRRGLFVFPLQSRMTGTQYSYLWMSLAQENGWHVVLDACALGPKDMDALGLSLIHPDFIISSFFKVFGGNPSGFGCLFVKKSNASILEASSMTRSIGIVSLVPASKSSQLLTKTSSIESETHETTKTESEDDIAITCSFSGPIPAYQENGSNERPSSSSRSQFEESEICETEILTSEIVELQNVSDSVEKKKIETSSGEMDTNLLMECRGLDHADSLGLLHISNRARCLINWLAHALTKLHHPHSEKGLPLIQIYGPKIKFVRGPALAFNVFDWKGQKVDPVLVQKLADRSNISLSYGFLHNLWFPEKYEDIKDRVLEPKNDNAEGTAGKKKKEKVEMRITAVTASLGFLTNFEDTYKLWAFVARFLDADFVEKERWRYMALNQQIIEV